MDDIAFSALEETISFYTRNDFAIINSLLVGNMNDLWKSALTAYKDNKGIIEEYKNGQRKIESDYDVKWLKILNKRLITDLDKSTKDKIIETARKDIYNILTAMHPIKNKILLYRTAWIDENNKMNNTYPYSHQYKSIYLTVNDIISIKTISSASLIPYREDEVDCNFYRYEITVPAGSNVLELDQFVCHNEDGEVLLPPMKCKVTGIHNSDKEKCKGIVEIEYIEQLGTA